MKKFMMTLAAVLCCTMTATVVNAQEAESPVKKSDSLAKAADDDPQDWKKQYDAAYFYLNEVNGTPDPKQVEKYATRALGIAQSQTVKRDTILGKSFELMAGLGMCNKNIDQALGYYDQAIRAYIDELGYENAAIPPRIAFIASMKWLFHSMGAYTVGDADAVKSFREAFMLNDQLPEGQRAKGMGDALTIFAIAHETLVAELKYLMKDKVWQYKTEGKTYTVLALDDWTVDKPDGFLTTLIVDRQNNKQESDYKYPFVLMDEQGNITEHKPSEFFLNVRFNLMDNAYHLSDETTLRAVSVTDEKRQQIIDAFHKYISQ